MDTINKEYNLKIVNTEQGFSIQKVVFNLSPIEIIGLLTWARKDLIKGMKGKVPKSVLVTREIQTEASKLPDLLDKYQQEFGKSSLDFSKPENKEKLSQYLIKNNN